MRTTVKTVIIQLIMITKLSKWIMITKQSKWIMIIEKMRKRLLSSQKRAVSSVDLGVWPCNLEILDQAFHKVREQIPDKV